MNSTFDVIKIAFFSPVQHCDHLAWERERWPLYLSCICLFSLHALIYVLFFLPLGVRGWLRLVIIALPGHYY